VLLAGVTMEDWKEQLQLHSLLGKLATLHLQQSILKSEVKYYKDKRNYKS